MLFNSPPGLPATPQNLAFVRIAIVCAAFVLFDLVYRITRGSPLALPARFAGLFVSLFVVSSAFQLRLVLAAIPAVAACAGAALSFFCKASAPTEIYTLSLHDALPI